MRTFLNLDAQPCGPHSWILLDDWDEMLTNLLQQVQTSEGLRAVTSSGRCVSRLDASKQTA